MCGAFGGVTHTQYVFQRGFHSSLCNSYCVGPYPHFPLKMATYPCYESWEMVTKFVFATFKIHKNTCKKVGGTCKKVIGAINLAAFHKTNLSWRPIQCIIV